MLSNTVFCSHDAFKLKNNTHKKGEKNNKIMHMIIFEEISLIWRFGKTYVNNLRSSISIYC